MTEELTNKIKEVLPMLEGWCVEEKAEKLAEYITVKYKELNGEYPSNVVELGVFGGKSLIPMALALRQNWDTHNVRGVITGIDMWQKEAAHEGEIGKENVKYWEEVDFDYVYKTMMKVIEKEQLEPYIQLKKGKSYEFGNLFEDKSIDILHQDSSHSEKTSLAEVYLYSEKVKDGCLWILDDFDWVDDSGNYTLRPAYNKLIELGFSELEDCAATSLQAHYKILKR